MGRSLNLAKPRISLRIRRIKLRRITLPAGLVNRRKHAKRKNYAELKNYLLKDASLVEDMLGRSIRGILDKDIDLLEEVINTNEPAANDYDREIERMCVEMIAQYEPVAIDLRLVIMIIKMNKDLERMADHAVNICESGLFLLKNPVNGLSDKLKRHGGQHDEYAQK